MKKILYFIIGLGSLPLALIINVVNYFVERGESFIAEYQYEKRIEENLKKLDDYEKTEEYKKLLNQLEDEA